VKAPLRFDQFEVITFDCYGTLIDWESGMLDAIGAALAAHSQKVDSDTVLKTYSELEPALQAGDYRPYREILGLVMRGLGERLGVKFSAKEEESLAHTLPTWKPFPDTVAALRRLKTKYRLGIISNIDDDLFAATAQLLETSFDYVITAQQARSYKPSLRNFELALSTIGLPREKILHAAESVYHDVIPAKNLGLHSVWVNRRMGRAGARASGTAAGEPDLVVPDLKTVAELAC
jgi:2-haloacid dehalogenase